jgi:Protein of unknown function (DUF2934)
MAKSRRKIEDSGSTNSATATLPQSVGDTTVSESDRDRIAARAYELYLARGGSHGLDMEDWLVAEREVRGQSGRSNGDE